MGKNGLVCVIMGIFVLGLWGGVFAWTEADSTTSKKTIQASKILPQKYQESYEINSGLFEKKPSQYNQYKPQDAESEGLIKKDNSLAQIDNLIQSRPAAQDISAAEKNKPLTQEPALFSNQTGSALEVISKEGIVENPAEGNARETKPQEALELKERSGDNPLNLKESRVKKGKSGIPRNQIKLEGIAEGQQEQQEDKAIQLFPKIKSQAIYHGSVPEGEVKQKSPKPFSDRIPAER